MDLAFELPLDVARAEALDAVPDVPGVLLLCFEHGLPYIGRTARLQLRMRRLLGSFNPDSRAGELLTATRRASYQPTGSPFESALLLYRLALAHRPEHYRRYLKLRPPPLVKVHLANEYPRTYVTRRLTGRRALFFGPFVSRAAAERFESAFLDLFKIRRCRENLEPDPAHPGCIYGEMDMCLRPCQARSTLEKYRGEVGRVLDFLASNGASLVQVIERRRDDASTALEFEEAARQHRVLQKVEDALKLKDDLARDIDRLLGFVIQPSVSEQSVELWMLYKGFLQPRRTFRFGAENGKPVSLDRRLRETLSDVEASTGNTQELTDHLALLNRWYHSSWRGGELVLFDRIDQIPYRRLVNAISRVAAGRARGWK